jgi:catechol 2,3-dioxygenase-like lactoylglutathione lyase family enzyme
MPTFTKNTPNLIVSDLNRSLAFYRDVLGFSVVTTVPDKPPFVFAMLQSGAVEIFLNDAAAAIKEHPAWAGQPMVAFGHSLFIEVDGIDDLHARLVGRAPVWMPIVTRWYGMREFGVADPDGYLITFAQRVG